MKIGLRFIASILSPFLAGLYASFLTYYVLDPARPFGFEKEYLLGVCFSLGLNLTMVMWLSIGIDQTAENFGLSHWKKYVFQVVSYSLAGYLPVIIGWLISSDGHASLFYPQATFYLMVSLIYLHVLLGLHVLLKRHRKKRRQELIC